MTPAFVEALAARRIQEGPGWMRPIRQSALDAFAKIGLPTQKLEDWKYTSLAPFGSVPFGAPSKPWTPEVAAVSPDAPCRVVFVNGVWSRELSGLAPGLTVTSFQKHPELFQSHATLPMSQLNRALLQDGVLIEIGAGASPGLISLVYLASADVAAFPAVWVHAAPGSRVSLVQTFWSEGRAFTDAVLDVRVAEGAFVTSYLFQQESPEAAHVSLTQVQQGKNSRFESHVIATGGAVARDEIRVRLEGEGASCTLNGLYAGSGKQHLDQHTLIDHAKPRCTSRELYKGVLDGSSHGVFTGRVMVREDAQKTDSNQTNKNLLLSETAQVDTRPQLEILADDVKCTHGSAVGQIDDASMFYLRSRGIDRKAAQTLLTTAFVDEVLSAMPDESLRERARRLM